MYYHNFNVGYQVFIIILLTFYTILHTISDVSWTNCFQKMGGCPKREAPQYGLVRILRKHKITGKALAIEILKAIKLPPGN